MNSSEKELANKVTAWVSDIFNTNMGEKPIQVLDTDGKPPSLDNAFLYNPLLGTWEGKLVLNSGVTLGFLIYNDKDGTVFKTFQT
jgi:hypothetical protein